MRTEYYRQWQKGYFVDTDNLSVRKAAMAGFVQGVGENKFEPNRLITREEMTTMKVRVIKYEMFPTWTLGTDGSDRYYLAVVPGTPIFVDDAQISKYAKTSVYYAYQYGIINGVGNGNFNPKGTATIQEAILIALRLYKKLPEMRPLGLPIEKFFRCVEPHDAPASDGGAYHLGDIVYFIEVSSERGYVRGYRATKDFKIYGPEILISAGSFKLA